MAKLDSYLERKSEAMAARRADFGANPSAGVIIISASSELAGITGARPTRMGQHAIVSDSASGLAGHGLGPTAPEMLLGSLASCLVHTYVIQAVLLNIPLDQVRVDIAGTLDMRPVIGMPSESDTPNGIQNIQYTAVLESPAAPEDIERLHQSVEQNCPVLNTLRFPGSITRNNITP